LSSLGSFWKNIFQEEENLLGKMEAMGVEDMSVDTWDFST
jgi:hypothetical protein